MLVTLTEWASIMEIEVTGINVGYLTEGATIMEIEVTGINVGYFNGRGTHYGNWGYRD